MFRMRRLKLRNQHHHFGLEAESLEEILGSAGLLFGLAGLVLVLLLEDLLQLLSSLYASLLGERGVINHLLQFKVSGVSEGIGVVSGDEARG